MAAEYLVILRTILWQCDLQPFTYKNVVSRLP